MKIDIYVNKSSSSAGNISYISKVANKLNSIFCFPLVSNIGDYLKIEDIQNNEADRFIATFLLLCNNSVYVSWKDGPNITIQYNSSWETVWNQIKYVDFSNGIYVDIK